jgi:mannitol 2-dehydrogenase
VIGSIVEYLFAPDAPDAVIDKLADEATRIVSLTVTEGGYNIHNVTGEFNAENPDVAHDLQPGATPRTTFGLITEGLRRRRERGVAPFTVMTCDNIPGNGHLAGTVFAAFARLRDPDLGDWVEREVKFPNSMVDRITPATTDTSGSASRTGGPSSASPSASGCSRTRSRSAGRRTRTRGCRSSMTSSRMS